MYLTSYEQEMNQQQEAINLSQFHGCIVVFSWLIFPEFV
jgi:hypothetical protein